MHIPPRYIRNSLLLLILSALLYVDAPAQTGVTGGFTPELETDILRLMKRGDIPGMSVVIVQKNKTQIRHFGYADLRDKLPVDSNTLFEIGSCSKAFTALAVAKLLNEHKLNLNDPVSKYLPWLRLYYKGKVHALTIANLLHHTSGIPWNTISLIPTGTEPDALLKTVQILNNSKLGHEPGKKYEYATINYDVLALIIQQVSGKAYEQYMEEEILTPLQLTHTRSGSPAPGGSMATGYKVSFFKPWRYEAPRFRGNNAAGYIITNAGDFARWLRLQMGYEQSPFDSIIPVTHHRDESVLPHELSSYAMGWNVSLRGDGEIFHDGLNPNFSAYIAFRPGDSTGIALLTNSSSNFTAYIGTEIIKKLTGDTTKATYLPANEMDKTFSLLSIIFFLYIFLIAGYFLLTVKHIRKGWRTRAAITRRDGIKFVTDLLLVAPFLLAIYLLPEAIADFSWRSIRIWTPYSFQVLILLMLVSLLVTYSVYFFTLFYRDRDKYRSMMPRILLFSFLSGLCNMIVITLITNSIGVEHNREYLIFYYGLAIAVYLLGRRFAQICLVKLTRNMAYEMKMELVNRIFSSSYQKFEQVDRGQIYTTLNNDIASIGETLNIITVLITSSFTALGAFIYLASVAFWATVITIFLIVSITFVYFIVSMRTNRFFDEARDTENVFMRLIHGLIDGYKELSLHKKKKNEYKADIEDTAATYRDKMVFANVRFVNAFLIGESLLVILLGVVVFVLPRLFSGIQDYTIMSFVIVLLYLIGPVNNILNSIPAILQLKVARKRVADFIAAIPVTPSAGGEKTIVPAVVQTFAVKELEFTYKKDNTDHSFSVGPVNIELHSGEILFIIGGNGSGKTTLGKLLTGLYEPMHGGIYINGKLVSQDELGEHYSTIFPSPYIFEKLYQINTADKQDQIHQYLRILKLEDKVKIENGRYSTLELSTGQLKRLALLQCFLEDSPIYLFDEWAADQDPEYRRFFYTQLLPEMKSHGKIIIAITHDDHYFHIADQILKMQNGKLVPYVSGTEPARL